MSCDLTPVRCGCGGEASVDYFIGEPSEGASYEVYCRKCEIHTMSYDTMTEAIEAWNKAMDVKDINVPDKFVADTNAGDKEPEQSRKFLEIVCRIPGFCTYPEYKGKPYYGIKYEENGETIVGFGTYKIEVLSQYLKDYFILSAEPERKKGKWIEDCRKRGFSECSKCGYIAVSVLSERLYNFCPNCGADMRGYHESA